ncbi:MAG: hypothetical protein OXN16_05865 [Gammaproteobacteria bacterium]|nr:hypothetical protein [Gammaproteobacteria bacterium]
MKSIDKFVLVLVASLALLLAGCGGGSSTTTPPVDPGPTAGEMAIMQAQTALTNAEAGLSGATTDAAMLAAYRAIQTAADNLVTALSTHGGSAADIAAAARKSGNAKAMADDLAEKVADAEMEANMAMVATAAKLYAGISASGGTGDDTRTAVYNTTDNADIDVTIGTGTAVTLSEDEDVTVAAHHGWEGQMFTAEPEGDEGTYEAVVYSHVGEAMEGKKFGGAAANDEFEYALTDGALSIDTSATGVPARVALPGVTRTAGTETFNLPDPNPNNEQVITVPGSFHGVTGTYNCDTGAGRDQACSASVAASGFTLTGTWTFTPDDPNTRLMDVPDNMYASYGWWIHKSEDGETFTASAFAANRGDVTAAAAIDTLQGTATYSGGAAGKYALHSTTGGTNDAGHFTADAMLQADFGDDMITGTIDNFVGADGESRNWSVELMETDISATGVIDGLDDASAEVGTAWTIDGTAGATGGQWRGNLYENGDDGVPSIGTGTFYSEFGRDGKMVGAFGVNLDD